jgi:multiple sugar transport system substrate-binding protein
MKIPRGAKIPSRRIKVALMGLLLLSSNLPGSWGAADPILFLSTQLTPLPEATMMREVILHDFPSDVDFEPYDRAVYNARVLDLASKPGSQAILGGLAEDFIALHQADALAEVGWALKSLPDRVFLPRVVGRGQLEDGGTYFVPWMQATYLMAANRRALRYLPKGAVLERLSYEELRQWAANLFRETGAAKLGFPVGPKGLMARFLQGHLYPSFTGSMANEFAGSSAISMWQYFRDLWQYVSRSSLILNRMDEALLNGEVWVVWDHSARLIEAFKARPEEFVAFPVPVGPRGRGFISVVAGLGLPKGADSAPAERLMEYLTRPQIQVRMMENVGFLPVVEVPPGEQLSEGLQKLTQATAAQLGSASAIFSSVPLRVADAGRRFDLVYKVAFSQIVLRGFSIDAVLRTQVGKLREILAGDRPAVSNVRGH